MTQENYHIKRVRIIGYNMKTMKIGDNYTISIPIGKNTKDRNLFNKLVYYNQNILYSKKRNTLIKQVKNFIKQNKR